MSKINPSSYNIRYFLWNKEKQNRENWLNELIKILGCSKTRAKQLLLNDPLTAAEQQTLAEKFELPEEELANSLFFVNKVNILQENLKYLLESVEQQKLAAKIGVTPRSISRWKYGEHDIKEKYLLALQKYFRLPYEINLRSDPVFLSWTPIDDQRRREWINEQIRDIDSEDLLKLFPAFEKLLKD